MPGGNGGYGWITRLQAADGADVSGQAAFKDNGDGTTTVVLELHGACGDRAFSAAIYGGTPDRYDSQAAFPLAEVRDCTSTTLLNVPLKELQGSERVIVVQDPAGIAMYGQLNAI